ncbi:MAG: bifunctional phosphoribosylaminoimidazolecarboxamide formyltransferase/IMP cyclohydrolase [Planctomycetota bacterium]|nr:bifunctional phosphoribosylaminoimidazolecarboxamide formyltransferase/IMP cyclohydrolase [Planctomycetota bacterium]
MSDLVPIRHALICVSDKTGLPAFAGALADLGVQIVCTAGTAAILAEAGIKVRRTEEITGFEEIAGGRVKTLHTAIHGAVLARRNVEADLEALRRHGINPIDLVCVNLYPFEETILDENVADSEAIEQIDIGGPALLRSAAKNHQFVTVVSSPDQYERVINELQANNGATSLDLRRDLAVTAFHRTAEYDSCISAWMASSREGAFPSILRLKYIRKSELRYGENPHQEAAAYIDPASAEPSVLSGEVLHGKPLSYNNIHDAAAALELIQDLDELYSGRCCAAIIKHTNPCGVGVADTSAAAFDLAYNGDPRAAYGGVLAVNSRIDKTTSQRICEGEKFLEVIVAPDFDQPAHEMLGDRWKNVRLLAVGTLKAGGNRQMTYKSIVGGMLVQERDASPADLGQWNHAAGPAPSAAMHANAAFVWSVVKHLKSNAVAIGRAGQLIGAGAGQLDRVSACRIAIDKAGDRIKGDPEAIAASDAFFPFTDGPQLLIEAGIRCIVHPGGSKRDQDTLDLCNEHNVTCLLTGIRHFRH